MTNRACLPATLDLAFQTGVLAVLAAILTAAMVLQYGYGELPCPLCLLQRLAMLGIGFAIVMNLRSGPSDRWSGLAMIFAIFLLVVAARQTLLDIYPRPGHTYIGTAVLGLHMPVWSVLIGLAVLLAYALRLAVIGPARAPAQAAGAGALGAAARLLAVYMIALAAINFASVILQCGLGECYTTGYALLK